MATIWILEPIGQTSVEPEFQWGLNMQTIVQNYINHLSALYPSPFRFDSHLLVDHVFREHSGAWQTLVLNRGSVALAHGYIAQVIGLCGATQCGEVVSVSIFGRPELNKLWQV